MKILLFSDSHGAVGNMIEAIEKEKDFYMVVFAGDVAKDAEELRLCYPRLCIAEVVGNNDFFVKSIPEDRLFELEGKRIFLTHGHKYNVKYSTAQLAAAAKRQGADIAIYGHTHFRDFDVVNGVTLINSGTARKSYGVLTIENGEIHVEFKDI